MFVYLLYFVYVIENILSIKIRFKNNINYRNEIYKKEF